MGKHKKHRPHEVFAISKCETFNPLLPDAYGVVYTKHHVQRYRNKGKYSYAIVDTEIFREEALELIEQHEMTKMMSCEWGTLWDTVPSFRNECIKHKLKYPENLKS
jgi:hypothetical protein